MTITIKNNRITTKTFEKKINLHLYILQHSAHPHGCFKGLVEGMIRRYFYLNSDIVDFISMVRKLYTRLINRGHHKSDTKKLIVDAVHNLTPRNYTSKISNPNPTLPFIVKATYQRNLKRSTLRNII